MNYVAIILAVTAVLMLFIFLWQGNRISTERAQECLRAGALIIDVRSPGEYAYGHLPKAINFPLIDIETAIPRRIQDKNRILLLHCQTGMRSGAAAKRLKNLGYTNAHNLGSYERAAELLSAPVAAE